MSSPAPPPLSPPSRKKPSVVATCILLALIIGVLGAVTGGGYWAYKTFVAKKLPQLTSKADETTSALDIRPQAPVDRPRRKEYPLENDRHRDPNTADTRPHPQFGPLRNGDGHPLDHSNHGGTDTTRHSASLPLHDNGCQRIEAGDPDRAAA